MPEIAEMIAPSLDEHGVASYTCCGLIRGRSFTAASLGLEVWLPRRPCAGVELAVDERLGGASVSWPPWETEGVPRTPRRESRTAGHRARRWAGAGYSFQPGRTSPDW